MEVLPDRVVVLMTQLANPTSLNAEWRGFQSLDSHRTSRRSLRDAVIKMVCEIDHDFIAITEAECQGWVDRHNERLQLKVTTQKDSDVDVELYVSYRTSVTSN